MKEAVQRTDHHLLDSQTVITAQGASVTRSLLVADCMEKLTDVTIGLPFSNG